jgi:nucleotide-binding universal stress UspA family protein
MIEIKRILCPVDFSDYSRRALEHAVVLARWYDAEITVLHAYGLPVPPVLEGAYPGPVAWTVITPPLPELRDQIVDQLKSFLDSVRSTGVSLYFEAVGCRAVPGILTAADTMPADLIVLGTHGRGGLDRLALGSVTEKVLRKASCAVMTVPPAVSSAPIGGPVLFERILCPVDFSNSSMNALAHALSLAQEADARLSLLHVVEALPHWDRPTFDVSAYEDAMTTAAYERLQEAIPDEARAWCTPEVLVTKGSSYREILRVARERDAHVIVMGVQGRNAVDLMVFGSTTHHVIREATCPVLTLRG